MEMKSDSWLELVEMIKQSVLKIFTNELYIPLHGKYTTNSEEEPFDLVEKINPFFVFDEASINDPKVMLLMGDAGSGKSMFSQQLHQQLWRAYAAGDPIPLWIPLPELENPFDSAVEEILRKYGFDNGKIAEIKAKEKFIFIVDGYDELHQFQNCYVTNKWEKWNAKVLITCRSQALFYQKDPDKYFMPFKGDKRLPMLLRRLYVAPFSKEQIIAYVNKYQQSNTEHKISEEDFAKFSGLTELINTPFLLHLAVEVLPDILADQVGNEKMTQAKLYDIFIERWFTRQVEKLSAAGLLKDTEQTTKQQFWDYCKRLSQQMHEKQVSVIPYLGSKVGGRLFGKQSTNFWDPFFKDGTEVLRSACPLKRFGDNNYGFVHASMIEYFATRAMYEEMTQAVYTPIEFNELENCHPGFHRNDISGEVQNEEAESPRKNNQPRAGIHQRLFSEEKNLIRFLADRIEMSEAFKQKMLIILEASKKSEHFAIGAANAITALVKAGITFNSQNLSGIKILGADISGGYFDQADLSVADLRHTRMRNVWMREATLCGSHVEGINFGEYPGIIFKQNKSLECLDYREDLQLCVSGSAKNLILWDTATGERLNKLHGHSDSVSSVQFSPNGQWIVSGSQDNSIRIWEVDTGAELAVLQGHKYGVNSVDFSPNAENVVSGSNDGTVRIWDVEKIEEKHKFSGHEERVNSVQFSPNGEWVVSGSNDKTIRIWNIASGGMIALLGHESWVTCVKFSLDGERVVSCDGGGHNDTLRLWDVRSQKLIGMLSGHEYPVPEAVAFSPKSERFVSGGYDKTVRVWDIVSQKVLFELRGHEESVIYVQFSQDGKRVISGSRDGTLRVWNVGGEPFLARTREYEGRIDSVQFSRDGRRMALISDDDTVRIWEVGTGKERFVLREHDLDKETTDEKEVVSEVRNGIAPTAQFSPDGKWVVSGGRDGIVRLWEVESERLVREFQGHRSRVYGLSFSPNGEMVVSGGGVYRSRSGGDTSIRIWDVRSGKELMILQGYEKIVRSVAFSHDGNRVFSRNDDTSLSNTTLSVWEISSQKEVARWDCDSENNVSSVSFSSHKDMAGYHVRGYVRVVNLENGKTIFEMPVEKNALKVQFIWECNHIIMGCNKTIQIWDMATQQRIMAWTFPDTVKGFSYHQNGALIVGFNKNKDITCWQITGEQINDNLQFRWSNEIDSTNLIVEGLKISDVIGLSDQNRRLLEQRGAIVEVKQNENAMVQSPALLLPSAKLNSDVGRHTGSPIHHKSDLPPHRSENQEVTSVSENLAINEHFGQADF